LAAKPTLIPDRMVTEKFDLIVRPILQFLMDAGSVVATLRKTRDLLLSRLVSGEIDVQNLDIVSEDAAA
jgi:type I restriction enzyme S subunit